MPWMKWLPWSRAAAVPRIVSFANARPDGAAGSDYLFGARTRVLMSEIAPTSEADYLSGMLIGHEINSAGGSGPVLVVGTESLVERYARAFRLRGRETRVFNGELATVKGLRLIHDLAAKRGQ